jgi:hypothetical protein
MFVPFLQATFQIFSSSPSAERRSGDTEVCLLVQVFVETTWPPCSHGLKKRTDLMMAATDLLLDVFSV